MRSPLPKPASIRRPLLAFAALCVSCQALEPTIKDRQVAPRQRVEEARPTLVLPKPEPEPRTPKPPPKPERKTAHLPGTEKVKLAFSGMYLAEAVHAITNQANVNVYLDASLDRPVDAIFNSITLDDALQTLLTRNGLQLVEEPPGVYWVALADGSEIEERRFHLESARVADIETNLRTLVSTGAQLVLDKDQNFVLVRGKRADIELIGEYILAADRLKKQVLIEMRIVEVTLGEKFELGVSHGFEDVEIGGNALSLMQQFTTPAQNFNLEFAANDGTIDTTLQALGRYLGIDLLSSPRVVAVNNTEATIEILREVPYIKASTQVTSGTAGGTGSSSTTEVAFKDVGITFKVTPAIREAGIIEFQLDQDLSEVGDILNGVPAVDHRRLTSRFQVKNGTTLVVGGLMQDRKSRTDSGVPGLMDIPLLGLFFKSKEDSVEKRELLVFFTPRIIALDDADGVSDRWREVLDRRRREMGLDPGVDAERQQAAAERRAAEHAAAGERASRDPSEATSNSTVGDSR